MTQQTQSSTNQDPGYEMDGVTGFGNGGTSSPWSPGDMQNKIFHGVDDGHVGNFSDTHFICSCLGFQIFS